MTKTDTKQAPKENTAPVRYPKEKILTFERFAGRVDLLRALLKDGVCYTTDEAAAAIDKFMKGGK